MQKPGLIKRLALALNKTAFEQYVYDFNHGNDVVTVASSKDVAMTFSAVFACFRVLAETFASVPIHEYKKLPNGDRIQTNDTGLYPILHGKANDEMSSYNFKEASMYQLCGGGDAISIRSFNYAGGLTALTPIERQNIRVDRDKDTKKLIYIVNNDYSRPYSRDEVFHVPGPSVNGIIGMSIIEYAASAIKLGLNYEKFGNKFYENGAMPSGAFEHPTSLNKEAYDRLKAGLKENYSGMTNAGVPMLLEDGLKYNPFTMKLVDAEYLTSRKFEVEEICRYCRVPLHLIQNLDRATNNNIEHQSLEFAMYTMLPHFKRWEEAINTFLLTDYWSRQGYYFEFDMNAMVRGDIESRYRAYAIARQWGWASANDILRLENLPRIPNGDIYLQPSNMIEAGTDPYKNQDMTVDPKIKKEIEDLLDRKNYVKI